MLHGRVKQPHSEDQLSEVEVEGQPLFISRCGLQADQATRVRVLARDVVLALSPPSDISLLNCLKTRVIDLQPDATPSQLLVRLGLGDQTMLARVSRRSAASLGLRENLRVYALVKGVAMS